MKRKVSIIILIIQAVLTIGAIAVGAILGFIPDGYMAGFIVLALVFMAYGFVSQLSRKYYRIGRVLCIIFCVLYISGSAYAITNQSKYDDSYDFQVIENSKGLSYITLKSEQITKLSEATDYTIGVSQDQTSVVTDEIESVKKKFGHKVNIAQMENLTELIEALYSGRVQIIIFEESDQKTVNENHALFEEDTKCLEQ
jgi:hypothetical protein